MQPAGFYVHIPFCEKKCGYCDFYSIVSSDLKAKFTAAVIQEIKMTAALYPHYLIDSIFFGGGTPTCLANHELQLIWDAIHTHFKIDSRGEFSIEANPGTIHPAKLHFLNSLGFNRLSIGAQSFRQTELNFLGRIHSVQDIYQSVKWAQNAGFDNINIDLITAFPGITPAGFQKSLAEAVKLNISHIACYTLIFEPGTPFYRKMEKGELQPLTSDEEAIYYELANSFLDAHGFSAYEVSNFCNSKDKMCRHNLKYWQHQPYLGVGPSAHSFSSPIRRRNIRPIKKYLETVLQNRLPIEEEETLNDAQLEFEYIFLNLRLRSGLNMNEYAKKFGSIFSDKYKYPLQKLIADGYIEMNQYICKLSQKGWLLADEIAPWF